MRLSMSGGALFSPPRAIPLDLYEKTNLPFFMANKPTRLCKYLLGLCVITGPQPESLPRCENGATREDTLETRPRMGDKTD